MIMNYDDPHSSTWFSSSMFWENPTLRPQYLVLLLDVLEEPNPATQAVNAIVLSSPVFVRQGLVGLLDLNELLVSPGLQGIGVKRRG